ncbi:unnamed protein product [Medioppia subpectinata]|uniref:Transmembrane 9 superfamily member n=1 Tax=Medioppia subpectinata TaxID=1979941 RepID=A0A7R9KGP4_9ACAR|nr:unnamed protein product [Medioppia subpectinata]CAG2103217.1 unnamed protein product [Medioppia subpectinata]
MVVNNTSQPMTTSLSQPLIRYIKYIMMNDKSHPQFLWLLILCLIRETLSDHNSHTYKDNDEVLSWMSTVGPRYNKYRAYGVSHYLKSRAESRLGVKLEFSVNNYQTYCAIELNAEKVRAFKEALNNHYWYEMFVDDLPVWGSVGQTDAKHDGYYLWTHKKLDIGYNGNHIVDANLTSQVLVRLEPNKRIDFSYEVNWHKSDITFESRLDKYKRSASVQHRINWLVIFSFRCRVTMAGTTVQLYNTSHFIPVPQTTYCRHLSGQGLIGTTDDNTSYENLSNLQGIVQK